MLNRVVLVGRLTKDPELRYTPSSVAVTNFTLAVDRNFKNAQGERETDFIPCVAYRQTAEFVANYLAKGKLAGVDGRIQIRTYTDNDNKKHWVTEIIVENVHLLSPKDAGQTQAQTPPIQTQPSTQYGAPPPGYGSGTQGYQAPAQGYGQSSPPPGYGAPPGTGHPPGYPPQGGTGQPPAQGQWQSNPAPQGPSGSVPPSRYGHEVNLDDDIPF